MKEITNYIPAKLNNGEEKDYKLTVCIVIYNIAPYLEKCINSAISQTYKNLEILLIDDGSTDGCGLICDKYACIDSRVKVIHKENGGVASARNCGLNNASGDYFTFLDGDDYIDANMYEVMMSALLTEKADMSICRYRQVDSDGIIEDSSTDSAYLYDGLELLETFLSEDPRYAIQNAPWNKVYKRELTKGLVFPPGIYEDALYTPELLAKVKKAVYIDKSMYNYVRDRGTSIMNKATVNPHIFTELIPNYLKRSEFVKTLGRDDLYALSDYYLFKRLLIFVTSVNRSNDSSKKDHLKYLDTVIKDNCDRIGVAYSCKYATANEYKKMKIYLKSSLLFRITMFLNDKFIIPVKQKIRS